MYLTCDPYLLCLALVMGFVDGNSFRQNLAQNDLILFTTQMQQIMCIGCYVHLFIYFGEKYIWVGGLEQY